MSKEKKARKSKAPAKGPKTERTFRIITGGAAGVDEGLKRAPRDERYGKSHPFMALRVPKALRSAFAKHAKEKGTTPAAILREHMSKVTGVELEADNDE